MTFDEGLKNALKSIEGLENKVYPIVAPEVVKPPFLVYRRSRGTYLKDLSGIKNEVDASYELILIANDYSQTQSYSEKIKDKLLSSLFGRVSEQGPILDDLDIEFTGEEYNYQTNAIKSGITINCKYKEE